MAKAAKQLYEFGGFRLDATEHLLYTQDGAVVPLKLKVVETLELLVRERGRLIKKDELMERLWPDAFVEESNLTQNIYQLRKVLGVDDEGRGYIETVPKRGYRFTAEVAEVSEVAPSSQSEVETVELVSPRSPLNSLAVLPMSNESEDPNVEYLSDGITESIISQLSQLPQLKVLARSTVFHYKGRKITPQEVGRDLKVGAVLTGRVQQLGNRLVVRTELVDANEGWQLWGEQYDRSSSDILDVQETIARKISDKLQLKLTGEDQNRLTKRYTENTEAYHLYIKARYYLNKRLIQSIQKAIEYFQEAIDVDPTYALAYVGLADCYPLLNLYGALIPREAYTKAGAAARKALEIDSTLAEAHNSLGVIKLFYEWDWAGAEASFQQALELNSGYPDVHQRYGMLLVARGRFAEAEAKLTQAQDLDPLSLITKTISGYPFYYARNYERAAERFREVIQMDSHYSMAHFRLGLTYSQQGLYELALAELYQSSKLSGDRDTIAAMGYVYGLSHKMSEAQAALVELDVREREGFVSSYDRALIHLGLGDVESSLDWLEKAYEERSYWLIYLNVDPALDPLRASPRFEKLLREVFGADAEISSPINAGPARQPPATPNDQEENVVSAGDTFSTAVSSVVELDNVKRAIRRAAPSNPSDSLVKAGSKPSRWLKRVAPLLVLLLLSVGLAFALGRLLWRSNHNVKSRAPLPFQDVRIKRITDSGDIADVALSPDGKSVAYVTILNAGWIQNLATGSRLQLFAESESEERRGLVFSPDGNQLYFYQGLKSKKLQLMRIAVLGGKAQKVLEDFNTWTAIAPDGKRFAFVRWRMEQGEQSLIISDGSSEHTVTTRKMPDYFELWGKTVAWSPEGKLIACIESLKHNNTALTSVLIVNPQVGSEMRLSNQGHRWDFLYDLTWLPDGKGLLVSAREDVSSTRQIWRVSYPEGEWRKVSNDLSDYEKLSVATDSSRMVAVQVNDFANLWILPQGDLRRARQLTFGNGRRDGWGGLSLTPDGKIVFVSNANGPTQIWITDVDGANLKQLTYGSEASNQPFVSPDGRYVVFTSYRDQKPHVWRMDIDGSNLVQLTDGSGELWPAVTPDGRDVTYTSSAPPYETTWSIPLAGGVAPKQLTVKNPISQANASPDGKLLATSFYDPDSLSNWRLGIFPAAGGEPLASFDKPLVGMVSWTPDSQSVMYVDQHYPYIWKQSIRGGPPVKVLALTPPDRIHSFAYSRDNSLLVLARGRPQSDALLIEDVK